MSIRRVMLVALLAVAITPPVQAVAAPPAADPASFVNPFIGTGSGGPVVGEVDTFPGATLPFGMVQWSPDTPRRPSGGGYRYDDHDITGFSLTHLSGVGCPTGGDLPFLPLTGAVPSDPRLPFSHADESASPGRYSVTAGRVPLPLPARAPTRLGPAAARGPGTRLLGRIRVSGGAAEQRTQFSTALYHTMLGPNLFSDADGRYRGFDGKVHRAARPQYANFSGWDIYRSEVPLLAMLAPEETSDMMASLLRDADEGGWLPKWPVAGGYTGVMNGDAADPILAGAYAFGARGFDARHALDLMVRGAEAAGPPGQGSYVERPSRVPYLARGYVPNTQSTSISPVPNGASETLEYALDDFAIGRLAGALGRTDVAARFHARSQNWANLFDTATGYVRPRDGDGAFPPGAPVPVGNGFGQSGFQEGNAAQYTWMVPQNLRALADGIGGGAPTGGPPQTRPHQATP